MDQLEKKHPPMNICVIGPESTAKSSLAHRLSVRLGIQMIPEYARAYLEDHGPDYDLNDLLQIGNEQAALIDKALITNRDFITDTDLLVILIWLEDKFDHISSDLTTRWKAQKADYYLLCRPDIPWIADPLREDPDRRDYFFDLFEARLRQHELPYTIIEGNGEKRFELALSTIQELRK
jgi:nicotinamide riboside kinase